MAKVAVNGVRSVSIGVSDLPASLKFYTDVWKLSVAAEQSGVVYLRASGADHHVLALQQRATPALLSLDFSAPDRSTVDALHAAVRKANIADVQSPAPIREPGGGYGFIFKDPEGRILRVIAEDVRHKDAAVVADRPAKVSHVVLNSPDRAGITEFYNTVLGFRLIDRTRMMNFLCCNSDHHSIAFADGDAATLNHLAFDMKDYDSVMRGAGRMRDHGYAIEWGVGRHGPGNNVFAYFVGPDDAVIEYTAEVEQVNENYRVRGPEEWVWPPGRIDHWGIAVGPTDRLKKAQKLLGFASEPVRPAA
jgi:catechol 2,3-dioxygenase-like lactoylglutathione lyase family enzyme